MVFRQSVARRLAASVVPFRPSRALCRSFFLELSLELFFSSSLISLSLARSAGRTPGPGGRPTTKSISTPPASVASSDGDRPSREELSLDLFGDSSCIPRTPLPHRSDQICENGVQKDCGGTNMLENILRNLQSSKR